MLLAELERAKWCKGSETYESVGELQREERRERSADQVSQEVIRNTQDDEEDDEGPEAEDEVRLEERNLHRGGELVEERDLAELVVELLADFNKLSSHILERKRQKPTEASGQTKVWRNDAQHS